MGTGEVKSTTASLCQSGTRPIPSQFCDDTLLNSYHASFADLYDELLHSSNERWAYKYPQFLGVTESRELLDERASCNTTSCVKSFYRSENDRLKILQYNMEALHSVNNLPNLLRATLPATVDPIDSAWKVIFIEGSERNFRASFQQPDIPFKQHTGPITHVVALIDQGSFTHNNEISGWYGSQDDFLMVWLAVQGNENVVASAYYGGNYQALKKELKVKWSSPRKQYIVGLANQNSDYIDKSAELLNFSISKSDAYSVTIKRNMLTGVY